MTTSADDSVANVDPMSGRPSKVVFRPVWFARLDDVSRREGRLAAVAGAMRDSFLVACLLRFGAINGRDRILVLAGQTFTTLLPLLIVISALGPKDDAVTVRLITRFGLTGPAEQAVATLFSRPPGVTGGLTLAGVLVLLLSVLSLTRSLQRTYEAAWGLPSAGVRGTVAGLSGFSLLVAQLIVLALLATGLRGVPAGDELSWLLRLTLSGLIWWQLQYLLLSRRIGRRQLVPGAVVAGLGQAAVSVYGAIEVPRLIERNAANYGVVGVTFALLTWLIVVCAGVVVVAVVSAEAGRRSAG